MIPADIGPHPDAPNYYTRMGKPEGWADEDCGTLGIRRVGATGDMLYEPAARIVRDDLPSGDVVYPCFAAEWVLSEDEKDRLLQKLLDGDRVAFRTLICGNGLPPMSLWLKGDEEV